MQTASMLPAWMPAGVQVFTAALPQRTVGPSVQRSRVTRSVTACAVTSNRPSTTDQSEPRARSVPLRVSRIEIFADGIRPASRTRS